MAILNSLTRTPSPLASDTVLLRGSSIFGMIAGVCWFLETLLHPVRNITTLAVDAKIENWEPIHLIGILSFLFALFALPGFYLVQRERGGLLGLLGFVLLYTGLALGIGAITPDAFVFPVLAKHSATANLLFFSGPLLSGSVGKMLIAAALSQFLGYLLFGAASLRAKFLPPWATWFVMVGYALTNLPILDDLVGTQTAFLLSNVGAAMFGVGYVWWSCTLWAHSKAVTRISPLATK